MRCNILFGPCVRVDPMEASRPVVATAAVLPCTPERKKGKKIIIILL